MGIRYRDIPGERDYRVGSDGSVWSRRNRWRVQTVWRKLSPGKIRSSATYIRHSVMLGRGRFCYVHHLVLEAFVGPRPRGAEACHKNGNPTDNRLSNLYWGSKKRNGEDTRKHGRKKGERHPLATLTDELVREIRRRSATGETQQSIADALGVQRRNVGRVADRTRWGHVK